MTKEQIEDRNAQCNRLTKVFWGALTGEVSVHHTAFLGAISATIYLYHRATGDDLDKLIADILKYIQDTRIAPNQPDPFEKPSRN